MAFDFPASPANGAQFTPIVGGPTYVYDSAATAWKISTGGLSTGVFIGDGPPANPLPGQLWFESDTGMTFIYYVDANSAQWIQFNMAPPPPPSFLSWPAGIGVDWWGPTEPAGTRFCYGQSLSTTTFAALFAAIAYQFGGSGANFLLPDTRGRVMAGKDNMGGTSANRLTGLPAGGGTFDGDVLGAVGGQETVVLATGHLPAHDHVPTYSGNAFYLNSGGAGYRLAFTSDGSATTLRTSLTGSDIAHANMQPTVICNKLITTGGVV